MLLRFGADKVFAYSYVQHVYLTFDQVAEKAPAKHSITISILLDYFLTPRASGKKTRICFISTSILKKPGAMIFLNTFKNIKNQSK